MKHRKWIIFFLMILVYFTACGRESFQDGRVYIVEKGGMMKEDSVVGWLDVKSSIPFVEEDTMQQKLSSQQLFLTKSPDETQIFYEEILLEQDESVLKGMGGTLVNLCVWDQVTNSTMVIAEQRPFISKVGWNKERTMVAFCGEERLTVFDIEKQRLMLEEDLEEESVTSFFWSPLESRKLYLEQLSSTIGLLYYMEPQKKAELYETTEKLYDKAQLDEKYFYGTKWAADEENKEVIYTVLVDKDKKIVKIIGQGDYQDHYLRSVLLTGENNYGLTYVANINQVSDREIVTDEYIYDAKFVAGGKFFYITAVDDFSSNRYYMHLVNAKGEEIQNIIVSGSSILLSEDGKIGYGSGPRHEKIRFETGNVQKQEDGNTMEVWKQALRSASNLYAEISLGKKVDEEVTKQFYANIDILEPLEKNTIEKKIKMVYCIRLLYMEDNDIGKRCIVEIVGQNEEQKQIQQRVTFQMIEKNNQWYVLQFEMGETDEES